MPATDFAKILGTVFERVDKKAKEQQDKQDKEKQEDLQMYRKVLFDYNSSTEQRLRAAAAIDKIRGMKGKESPFQRLAGLLNHVKSRHDETGAPQGGGQPGTAPPPAPVATGAGGVAEGGAPQKEPQKPQLSTGQKAVGEEALQKKGHGLGSVLTGIGDFFNPPAKQLPPLDPSVAPTADQLRDIKGKDLDSELGIREKYIEKQIRLRGEEAQKTARARAQNAMNAKQKYPGQALINSLPEDVRQKMVDDNGLPIDPNGIYGPTAGDQLSIEDDDEGRPVLKGVRVGTGPAREGGGEQIIYDPDTHTFKTFEVRRETHTPEAPKRVTPGSGPTLKTRGQNLPGAKTFQTPKGKTAGGRVVPGVPVRAFGPLQKQSNAIEEARNSLVGDDPTQIGGIAADLDVFKSPESVKRLSEYIGYVNAQLEDASRSAMGSGPVAAAEWYTGLPATISNLKQDVLRQYSQKLDGGQPDGPEHRFIADYYRNLGTLGGMRAATGASAAKWSFKNLQAEFLTPGPVTTYDEAARRLRNLVSETNVVAKNNPMVKKTDTQSLPGGASKPKKTPRAVLNGQTIIVEHGQWVYEKTHKPVQTQ